MTEPVLPDGATLLQAVDIAPFANRLAKNARHLHKWARRNDLQCYRLYDRDIPAFPLAVDWYDGRLHLQEFDTGWKQTPEQHYAWVMAVESAVSETLQVPKEQIWFKLRQRQRGETQYQKTGEEGEDFVVSERGHRFWVNLGAYLDTGLFLDHRNARQWVGELADGARFLNLFAYTGSFTIYAAAGGAVSTDTVDLSNTYQAWTARNLALNGFTGPQHRLHRADVFSWLREAVGRGDRYDLIVLDPPTFSNSKKMLGILDVQRDHPWMIRQCLSLLSPTGTLFFSNNLRQFELDAGIRAMAQVEDLSARSVPEDFRNQKIHHCYRIRHRAA